MRIKGRVVRRAFLRRAFLATTLVTTSFAISACAQGQASPGQAPQDSKQAAASYEPENYATTLRWVNTLIFGAALGYLISKTAPAFFNARSSDIRKAIEDATGLKIAADFRSSEIDRKMATLPQAVDQLRKEAAAEMDREHARIDADTQARLALMQRNTDFEIAAARLEGTRALRKTTADLAFAQAERRLVEQTSPSLEGLYLQDFVHVIEQGKN